MASRDIWGSPRDAGGSVVWRKVSGSGVLMAHKEKIMAHTSLLFTPKVAVCQASMLQNTI
jgi:hypothetical protein